MAVVRASVRVTGRVQGVWFRQSTKNTADQYGVTGWVRNNPDRSVEAVFEGEQERVQLLVDWCKKTGLSMIQLLPLNDVGFDKFMQIFQNSWLGDLKMITSLLCDLVGIL